MSNTWKNKVLPKFKKLFDKGKKRGAAEVCKTFDQSRESLDKEFEEKGADLSPKVVEIYRSSSTFIAKQLLKKPSENSVKENPAEVEGVLQELVKAGFPGTQVICNASKKYGPKYLSGPIVYLFEKASVYLAEEPLPEEPKDEKTRDMAVEDVKAADTPAGEPETSAVPEPSETEASAVKPPAGEEEKNEETQKEAEGPPLTAPPLADVSEPAPTKEIPLPSAAETTADPPAAAAQ